MNINNNHRIILLYSTVFIILSLITAYLPVWMYETLKLEIKHIGILIGTVGVLKSFTNILIIKDLKNIENQKKVLFMLSILIIFLFGIIIFLGTINNTFIVLIVFIGLIIFSPILPMVENICSNLNNNFIETYGKLRTSGSLSFLLGVLVIGKIVDNYKPDIFPFMLIFFFLLLLISIFLIPNKKPKNKNLFKGNLLKVLKNKNFLFILISCSLIQGSHAMYYSFSTILWRKYEISFWHIGQLWAWAIIAEIIFFFFIDKIKINKNLELVIFFTALLSAIRWVLSYFFNNFFELLLIQTLHAISFGLTHYIMMYFIHVCISNNNKLIAQSIYYSLSSGIIMTLLTFIAGWSFMYYSKGEGFIIMSASCLLSAILILIGQFGKKNGCSEKK